MSDLRDEVWLSGDSPSSCGEMVVRACRDAGFDPRVGFESDDYHVLQGFVAAGLGVTLLPDLALPTLRGDIAVLPTDPPAPMRRVWAETRRTRSAATEAMLGVLVEAGERFGKQYAKLVAVA
jgi:DNA-binding transcriptional LysR family regulator